MMGSLSNFTLRDVLDVVGLSRQYTVVELHGNDGSSLASINLKGGHLVQSASDQLDPREALGRALQAPKWCTFHVFRLDDIDTYQSFGQLAELLADEAALTSAAASAAAEAASKPSPAPVAAQTTYEPPPAPAPEAPIAPHAAPVSQPRAVPAESAATATPAPVTTGVSLAVASPKGGVGKTTIALNLGICLAHRGLRVIIIDADVNGDLMSLINARGSAEIGTYDLLHGSGQLERALRRTVVPGLQVLPAAGRQLPALALMSTDRSAKWRGLIRQAMGMADIVLVDCPAGMSHAALEILQSVSHVLGVFQAETVASRSFEMFERGLAALAERDRPRVAGVVVNMLRENKASARAYEKLVAGDTAGRVLKTVINRSEAFEEATAAATPVRLHSGDASRKAAFSFDNLASEIASRLPLPQAPADSTGSFML